MQQHNENDEESLVLTRRWLHYATEDLVEAKAMVQRPQYVPRHACFFAQQAAEKALKAVLVLYLKLGVSPFDWGTRWGVQPPDRR